MDEPTLSRQPPYSEDAEQAVLGGILLNPDRLADAQELLEPEDFYRRSNQLIFAAMNSLNDREINIDVVSVKEELERDNHLDDVGGVAYMAELADAVPTSTNVGYYAKIVNDKATMRRVIQAAQTIAAKGYDAPTSRLTCCLRPRKPLAVSARAVEIPGSGQSATCSKTPWMKSTKWRRTTTR